jgi:hypothetical protein
MNILKWVHKWTWFLQFLPFRWNVMAAHFFYSNLYNSFLLIIVACQTWGQLLSNVIDYITITSQFSWLHYITITSIFKCNRLNYNYMILTQTLLLNSHTVKHANCYGSSHYFLKILFINHTYKIQTKQGQSVAYPLATWYIFSP